MSTEQKPPSMERTSDSVLVLGDAEDFLKQSWSGENYAMTVADDGEAWCSGKPGPRVTEQFTLEMALRSVLRMDPEEILVSSQASPPADIVPAIILTGHRLVYWWKQGDKDRAMLRWHDWKFQKVLEVSPGHVRVLADVRKLHSSEELKGPVPPVSEDSFSPQQFKLLKDTVLAHARTGFRPRIVAEARKSFINPNGHPLLQLAEEEMPESVFSFPEGLPYLQLEWDESGEIGKVDFFAEPAKPAAHAVFLGDWEQAQSVPHYQDDRVDLEPELLQAWPSLKVASLIPWSGDQLGGWPFWVQGPQIVSCEECGSRMTSRFQLSSEPTALVPRLFAPSGTGQILQCSRHPRQMAWVWDC